MTEWADIPDESAFTRLVLTAPTPVIVAFETDDCGHCRQQRSLLALAWRHMGWTAPTLRLDATRLPRLADEHRIVGYPTIAVFVDGRLVERFPGRRDPATLTRRLTALLGGPGGEPDGGQRAPRPTDRLVALLTAREHVPPQADGELNVRTERAPASGEDAESAGSGLDSCRCTA